MAGNTKVLGLIFASMHDSSVRDMTAHRTMGSIMFGGRYRLIDFPLSNMVNSNFYEVGVITKSNYGSLLDHVGSGREWDLARKKGGLHLLPPFSQTGSREGVYRGRLEALNNVWSFLEHSKADYVVMSDCDFVTTIDFRPVIEQHIKTKADITTVYGKYMYNEDNNSDSAINVLEMNEDGRITNVLVNPLISGECNLSLDMFVMSREFLSKLVKDAASKGEHSLVADCLQARASEFNFMGYEHKGYFSRIDSNKSYFEANLALLDSDVRKRLFLPDAPIYTKIGDNGPARYGLEANVKNSLIADGCIIEGTVENCVIFRGVKIEKGSVVRNCVLQQGTKVGQNCSMNYVITDKNVEVSDGHVVNGSDTYPLYVKKNGKL